jgi:hypothetical protein
MSRLRRFAAGVWDFVVGDDWRIALGVAIALGLTAVLSGTSVGAWWILPVAVAILLLASVLGSGRAGG